MLKTRIHNIDSGAYAAILVRRYLKRVWWAYALPAAVFIGLGAADVRFIFLAVIYLFLVTPMIMGFALTAYGLVAESRYSILRHTLEAGPSGLTFTFVDDNDNATATETVEWGAIGCAQPTSKHIVMPLRHRRFRFIAIPYTAFDSPALLRQFMELLRASNVKVK